MKDTRIVIAIALKKASSLLLESLLDGVSNDDIKKDTTKRENNANAPPTKPTTLLNIFFINLQILSLNLFNAIPSA